MNNCGGANDEFQNFFSQLHVRQTCKQTHTHTMKTATTKVGYIKSI